MPTPKKPRTSKPNAQNSRSTQRKTETVSTNYTQTKKQAQRSGSKTPLKNQKPQQEKIGKLKLSQSLQAAWKAYEQHLAEGGAKLAEFEALRPFMGKRGNISQRATRSQKARREAQKAIKAIKAKHGDRPSKRKIQQAQDEKRTKKEEAVKKSKKTVRRKAAKQARKAAKESGEAKPEEAKKLKNIAKQAMEEAEEKYSRMLEIFSKGSQKTLQSKIRYELYREMDDQGISADDIEKFIDKIMQSLEDLPAEAVKLAQNDDFVKVLMNIRDMPDKSAEDFSAMVKAYVMGDSESVEQLNSAIDFWQENNPNNMGFEQFWKEAQGMNMDPDTWAEILGVDQEE